MISRFKLSQLSTLIAGSLLLSSCQKENTTFDIEIPPPPIQKKEIIPEITSNGEFLPFESKDELTKNFTFGKGDPFNMDSKESSTLFNPNHFQLKGILESKTSRHALILYKGDVIELKEGDLGGRTNKLLPNGILVKQIDSKGEKILLQLENETFTLELYND